MKIHLTLRYFFLFYLYLFFGGILSAQDYNTGLLLDEEAFQKEVELTPEFTNDGRRAGDLAFRVSLRDYCPKPKNQGEISSCIGWAMGYGALTISHAYREGNTDRDAITKKAFSALYLYNQSKMGNCMAGANIQRTAKILKEKGDCRSKEFDSPLADCDRMPNEDIVQESQKYAIKDYVALYNNSSKPNEKLARTKRSLAEGKPVIVGIKIKESLKSLTEESSTWKPGGAEDKSMGGHALVVVGYDEYAAEFELMNSWGPNWADHGFFRMSYRDFAMNTVQGLQLILPEEELSKEQKEALLAQQERAALAKKEAVAKQQEATHLKDLATNELKAAKTSQVELKIQAAEQQLEEAVQLEKAALDQKKQAETILEETADRLVALYGEFFVRTPETDDFGTLQFDEAGQVKFRMLQPAWNGSFYTLDKTDWEEGDGFQVIARNIKKDRYVYLFSFDSDEKLEVHWPRSLRDEMEGKAIDGAAESALVAHKGAEIIIPGEEGVLTRENLFDDNICVLYSFDKIIDIQDRFQRLKDNTGPFENRLHSAFSDLLIPSDLIEYGKQEMNCKTEVVGRGSIIPIIVKIQNL